jgi:hypothetical protein
MGTIAMGTTYLKSFDIELLNDAAYNAHLHDLQRILFASSDEKNPKNVISVIYLDADSIDTAYENISTKSLIGDSAVLIDLKTKIPLHIINFNDYTEKELPNAVSLQISEFLAALAGRSSISMSSVNVDVQKMIPIEVSLPTLPSVPQLMKSEYETKSIFNERIEKAVVEREETIRRLQQQYNHSVNNRNQYIEALGKSWQQYLDGKATEQNELVKKLKINQTKLARLLYTLNLGKLTASNLSYDAENKALYFTATSSRYGFKQKMVTKISAPLAKSIKEEGKYILTPELIIKDNIINMNGIALTETTRGGKFSTSYTDVSYKSEVTSVKVAVSNNKINTELSVLFKKYVQKPQTIVDSNLKEVWYVETVNRINAKVPDWFSSPEHSNNVLSYAVGDSHEEAMIAARKELAYMIRTSISAATEIFEHDNTIRSYQDVTQHVRATTNVELQAGDYSVYSQSESDGKFYVALCYHCNAN